jgi:hypothetical protein
MYLPGQTPYTKGSEIENVETSAWGRAIGALGILIDRSIATVNEIEDKKPPLATAPPTPPASDEPVYVGAWNETGALAVNKTTADGEVRQTPDGASLICILETPDDKRLQLQFTGQLASDVYDAAEGRLAGVIATCEGDLYRVPWKKAGKPMRPYQRLDVKRISTAGWTLPVAEAASLPLFPQEPEAEQLDAIMDDLP